MRNLKRVLTIVLAAVMLISTMAFCVSAAETKFTDVTTKDKYLYDAVTLLEGLGVTNGVTEDTFGTNDDVTREQMAVFVYRFMKAGKLIEGGENYTPFEDLYDDTYYSMISWASNVGIIKGISPTEFDPDGNIILQDAYAMLVRALGYETEKEPIAYPIGYIEIAESKGVDLGKGLPSKVTYTSKLTRGNIAVLLYNAFYADMAEKVTVQKERLLGEGANAKYILQTVEEPNKICEKYYGVIDQRFVVRETTHYAFNDKPNDNTFKPTEDSAGANTMLLVAADEDGKINSFYTTTEELGLAGSADNYIMSEVTIYYSYDENKEEITKIFFADAHMDMQTATSASYGSVQGSGIKGDADTYYVPNDPGWARMDGSMVVMGKQLYFFDAPYKFISPSYNGCTTEDDRYAVRNADNTKLIELKCLDADKGLYTYYITNDTFGPKDAGNKLAQMFGQVRTGGVYKMDIYDPDGDGRYEYMWYKPASFAKIIMDDDYTYANNSGVINIDSNATAANSLAKMPVIYGNGAVITGTSFKDEDFVLAYASPEGNYIDVMGVASAKQGTITSYNEPTGTIVLGNAAFRTCYQFLNVKNFFQYDYQAPQQSSGSANTNVFPFFTTARCLGAEVILYTYNHGVNGVYYYEIVGSSSSKYAGENLMIPLEAETEAVRDDKFELKQYLKVLVGGEEKYISVDVENCYPAPKKTANGTYLFDNTTTDENGKKYNVYLNKLCTYTTDSKGNYTIKSLFHGEDSDGDLDHIDLILDDKFFSEKKTYQAGNDLGILNNDETVVLKKLSGRYSLLDANDTDYSMLGTYGEKLGEDLWFSDAYVDGNTVFMIRTITDDDGDGIKESKITTYTGLTFPGNTDKATPISNVQYIYENYGTSKKHAKLVLFYGEVEEGLEFESGISKTGYRMVKSVTPVKVGDKEYRYSYDLLNLSTGALEEGVLGATIKKTATAITAVEAPVPGAIIELNDSGRVDEGAEAVDTINVDNNQKLVKLMDVVLEDNTIEIQPIRVADNNFFKDEVTDELFTIYEIGENVEVSVLTFGKKNDFETATVATLDLAALGEGKKELKAFNSKYSEDPDKSFTTEYAEYIKAYIVFDKKARDEFPVISNIVVIVNDGEDVGLLKLN